MTTRLMRLIGIGVYLLLLTSCDAASPDAAVESSQEAIYNGQLVTPETPQMLVSGGPNAGAACSATIYSAYWVISAAHCFGAYDDNGDGIITKDEMTNHGEPNAAIANGPDINGNAFDNPVDFVVKNREGTFGSGSGYDVALVHVTQPFGIAWMVNNLRASPTYAHLKYNNGVLRTWGGTSLLPVNTILYSFGFGIDGQSGHSRPRWGTPKVSEDLPESVTVINRNNQGTSCSGDSGGPTFRYASGAYYLFGIFSTWSGSCDANNSSTHDKTSYAWQWIKDWTGT